MTPGDQRSADGVVAGLKDERESAVDGGHDFGRAGAEAGLDEQDFVRWGKHYLCV